MSPPSEGAVGLRRKKRVCERCRRRKQRCDFEQEASCRNCILAGTECVTATPDTSLLNLGQYSSPGSWQRSGYPPPPASDVGDVGSHQARILSSHAGTSPSGGYQVSNGILEIEGQNCMSPGDQVTGRPTILSGFTNETLASEISIPTAASFFRTYCSVIHPQYPFLDIRECGDYYLRWKASLSGGRLGGWAAFFVNMIFAIGLLIESKADSAPHHKYQNLKSRAQAEQSIMADSSSTALIRMQAMLLSAMLALHAENTWRIAHVSGVIMKFASLHRFHRLKKVPNDPYNTMMIRVWSSAYTLDRSVSSALGTPVSLPDMYISSPLYEDGPEDGPEDECPMPWLSDCAPRERPELFPNLRTFAHICKIRTVQSLFMHMVEKDDLEDSVPLELQMHMLETLRKWEQPDVIAMHSIANTDGYHSALWLRHIGQLTRLSICWVNKSNIHSYIADTAFKASCEACTSFRSLRKKRQIAQPWLVVLSQFRAAVTLWYILWARAVPVPREADDAIRDCGAVLAIFADRWPNAEYYRDCFEILAVSIPRSRPLGNLEKDVRDKIKVLVHKLDEIGIHRTTSRMLWEMSAENDDPRQTRHLRRHPFIDDIGVGRAKTDYDGEEVAPGIRRLVLEHIQNLDKVLCDLERAGATVSREKSQFCVSGMKFVGYVCDARGRHPEYSMIEKIVNGRPARMLRKSKVLLDSASKQLSFFIDFSTTQVTMDCEDVASNVESEQQPISNALTQVGDLTFESTAETFAYLNNPTPTERIAACEELAERVTSKQDSTLPRNYEDELTKGLANLVLPIRAEMQGIRNIIQHIMSSGPRP
ncbi:hypothetical protein A1O1_09112 [Capronia coronata CBS 617.96]|uniref:Zn(2)-C6 fungal-type domain-containing protein n=1 Tax=Capronia coronata CBS 617.96 TaxID=1182541 RepID=W9XMZ8_9EURO|nr:uncharacterized protein A1O1_09112 [Capronia coronata CBS 617.96]EXJ78710.1 hypothetical protein A1O1_09112 [Capronia coronata CBS 617.96]